MDIQNLNLIRDMLDDGPQDITDENEAQTQQKAVRTSHVGQFEIVSRIAYLIGVEKKHFEIEGGSQKKAIYEELEKHKKALIIRDLCKVRTAVFANYTGIFHTLRKENYRNIDGLSEYLPVDSLQRLAENGVRMPTGTRDIDNFLSEVNSAIRDRINNCRSLIPDWIEWNYIFEFFAMPTGTTIEDIKAESRKYHENINFYPYRKYAYWPVSEQGNILYDDKRFVTLLYEWHGEEFKNLNLVCDVRDSTKETIYDFIEESGKIVFVVDCENSDPYALCAAISGLDQEKLEKIEKIILYDDIHAASAWEMLASYIKIPVEYMMITRIKDNKSLTDVKIAARICKEYYSNHIDSFVLVSSDSDFWGVIEELEGARFIFMVEQAKFGYSFKNTLLSKGIFYCFIDHFYAGDAMDIKEDAIRREFARLLKGALDINLLDMFEEALYHTRIKMEEDAKVRFIKKHIKPNMSLLVDDDFNLTLECRK